MLDLKRYSHTDDPVDIVKVTEENLEEVAAWCGGRVNEVEHRVTNPSVDSQETIVTRLGVDIPKTALKFPPLAILSTVWIGDVLLRHLDGGQFSIRQADSFAKFYREGGAEGFGEGTLDKVRDALSVFLDTNDVLNAINEMQNRGILFRELTN